MTEANYIRLGNRIFGLARAALYGYITYAITKEVATPIDVPFIITGTALKLDGLADLTLGAIHSLSNIKKRLRNQGH